MRERLDQQGQPLLFFQASDEANRERITGLTRQTWRAATINLRIKAELRNDVDRAMIALAPQHLLRRAIAGNGDFGVLVVVEFKLAEGWGIVAIEILPGEEERVRLVLYRQAHGMEGGEIIRLLVNMHDLWLHILHDLAQLRIIVQVEIAVEFHGRDDHGIAVGVETLKHLLTAIVTLPVFRRDQRKFNAGTLRQFFQFALRGARNESFGNHQYTHKLFPGAFIYLFIDRERFLRSFAPAKLSGALSRTRAHVCRQLLIGQDAIHSLDERIQVFGIDGECGIADDFGQRSAVGANNWCAATHGLQWIKAKTFVERGEDEHAGSAVEGRFILFFHETVDNLPAHTQFGPHRAWVWEERAVIFIRITRYEQLQAWVFEPPIEVGEGTHQLRNVLALIQAA